jgi:hypothetical protein
MGGTVGRILKCFGNTSEIAANIEKPSEGEILAPDEVEGTVW